MKDDTRDKWELKSNEVTMYEEIGHGAFGKVCKGIMCIKTSQSVSHTSKTIASSTVTVAVKMLQGTLRWFLQVHKHKPRIRRRLHTMLEKFENNGLSIIFRQRYAGGILKTEVNSENPS